jgi:molybdenum cofactor synthesis domain-containing protein
MFTCGIITISDKGYNGQREDKTGPILASFLSSKGFNINYTNIIPDEIDMIQKELVYVCDELTLNLVITNGGTGFSQRDVTPEATSNVIEKIVPGFSERMRYCSLEVTPKAILSRGVSGIRRKSIIINLPGSPKGALENLIYIIDSIPHGIEILNGTSTECAVSE